ncbi:MAG: LysR family transcriptional regulator [Pseudomonas sp.]
MPMKLSQLRILVALHESGSLQETSRRLHISQPALSRALKELEDELGVPLLARSNKGASLTPYGVSLLGHARSALESVRRARQDIDDMRGQTGQEVRIGLTTMASLLDPVQSAIAAFHLEHPQVRLTVLEQRPPQVQDLMQQGALDFALTSLIPAQTTSMEWLPICRKGMGVFARRGHPLANARHLRQLSGATWVCQDAPDNPNSVIYRLFEQNRMQVPPNAIECGAAQLVGKLILEADALFVGLDEAPSYLVQWMQRVQLEEKIPDSFIGILCPDRRLLTRMAAKLFDAMREALLARYPRFE